ncbi:MAG TPA: OmpH family outer membrane protein [Bacteroidales bacterium]|nr:OmpH family outer membrane protein [Bacteroidales bacterium]
MKNLAKVVLIIFLAGITTVSFAQKKQKFGHIDSNELLKLMPGRDSAMTKIQDYATTLENQLKGMQTELETKYQTYLSNEANMTDLIKQTNQKELQDIQARIEAFQESAQGELEKKQNELLKPIIDKAKAAIEKVGKDNQYTYIFDAGIGVLLYSDPTEDIMPMVKAELGLK